MRGTERGKQGSREAGKQAGKQASRQAGKQGRRDANHDCWGSSGVITYTPDHLAGAQDGRKRTQPPRGSLCRCAHEIARDHRPRSIAQHLLRRTEDSDPCSLVIHTLTPTRPTTRSLGDPILPFTGGVYGVYGVRRRRVASALPGSTAFARCVRICATAKSVRQVEREVCAIASVRIMGYVQNGAQTCRRETHNRRTRPAHAHAQTRPLIHFETSGVCSFSPCPVDRARSQSHNPVSPTTCLCLGWLRRGTCVHAG
jgi:hypothetical protein